MRHAADSITSADIPVGQYPLVCGYVDGAYAWSEQDWLRHTSTGAIAVGIAVLPTTDAGQVCDVESGDLTPDQAVRWVGMRRASGLETPTVYCSISAWPHVAAAFINAGVAQPNWWLAGYDDVPEIPAGAIGKQYANEPLTGGHYDLSVVADHWPGVDTGPGPSPAIPDFYTSGGDDTMVALSTPSGRLDLIYVGTDSHVYHRWQNSKINDLAADVESWGGGVVRLAACYTDGGNTIAVFAAVATGDVWFKEIAVSDGHTVNDWAALGGGTVVFNPAGATGPQGPPGPAGPPGAPAGPHTHTVTGTAQ